MSNSFEFPDLDRFTAGAVGPPGERVFYLQASAGNAVVSLRLEKTQVAALAEYLAQLLADLPAPETDEFPDDLELAEPVVAEWIVGRIGVVFDDSRDRMLLRLEELQAEEEEEEEGSVGAADEGGEQGVARFSLTRPQVAAFVVRAATVVAAGRPPCPLCGRPLDPSGHVCLKANGHRGR
jgi:uncharacterized repeat protein (TIGR03847 family)